jgi:hypothetical protein
VEPESSIADRMVALINALGSGAADGLIDDHLTRYNYDHTVL